MADPYSTLGVARGADEATIKKAYRKLAKELHPDRNRDNPAAAERFSKVTGAYDLLTDKDKRARFDRGEIDEDGNPKMPFGFGGGGPGAGPGGQYRRVDPNEFDLGGADAADLSDLFEGLFSGARGNRGGPGQGPGGGFGGFGRRAPPPPKGADVAYRYEVSFAEAALLTPQRVTLRGGKTLDIKLPKGVEDGARIRLTGQGEVGQGGKGDAIVTIAIKPHPFFKREPAPSKDGGDNIRLDLPVSLDEAVLGGKVKVPTVDGPVMLAVPPGSSSGKVLRLKGRGFTGKDGSRGDQLVTLQITVPEDDNALKNFLESWAGKGQGNPRASLGV